MRFRTRAKLLIVLMFLALRFADVAEWQYFANAEPLLNVPENIINSQYALLAANAIVTTFLLGAMWQHRRWIRAFFITWMYVSVLGAFVGISCVGYSWSTFPTLYICSGVAKLLAFGIMSFSKDLAYYLSPYYAPHPAAPDKLNDTKNHAFPQLSVPDSKLKT